MEHSASLRLGEHLTSALVRPWRFPFLPVSFPLLCLRIGLERIGWMEPPEHRIEWQRKKEGHGILVYIDGFTKKHAKHVRQDLEDMKQLQPNIEVSVVCTSSFQSIFKDAAFPVFILPEKQQLPAGKYDDWGTLLEEQLGGISGFFEPATVLIVGPYPHRALKNLVRSNPSLNLVLDQRPKTKNPKETGLSFYTHLSGVLRVHDDSGSLPESTVVHAVGEFGLASWIANTHQNLTEEIDETLEFNIEESKQLIELAKDANRDTKVISDHLDRLNLEHGIEKIYSLLVYSLLVFEQLDESPEKRITRDIFVAALRSLGASNFEHMVELAEWRMHRYQDERAAKSVIQFLRNADRPTEASLYLKYVKDEEWKKKEIKTVTSKMLHSYGIQQSFGSELKTLGEFEVDELSYLIRGELETGRLGAVEGYLDICGKNTLKKVEFLIKFLKATEDIRNDCIPKFLMEKASFSHDSKQLAHQLNYAHMMYGQHEEAVKALFLGPTDPLEPLALKSQTISDKINGTWLSGIPLPEPTRKITSVSGKVLYLVHMSLPFESAGYCTRTHGLLTNLLNSNQELVVQSRYGYPLDKGKLRHLTPDDVQPRMEIDGLTYCFDRDQDLGIGDPDERGYIHRAAQQLVEHALVEQPALIQAASNHVNGAIGLKAARALGLPFVYEVRGLWHMSRVSRQPHFLHHCEYQAMDEAELAVCKEADTVLAITHAVRYYLIDKGVDSSKIFVLPNGVDSHRFQPVTEDNNLREELGLTDGPVIGYVGSFVGYEGLDLLVDAFAKLVEHRPDANLLLVGDGDTKAALEKQVNRLGLDERVVFTGRVSHDDVERYHSLIDIAPFPRTPDIVCEFISPLKPFESMAMGQLVIASDVAALKEIIVDGENGRLFKKGDSHSLYEVLNDVLGDDQLCQRLASAGTEWVRANRDWKTLATYLSFVHASLLEDAEPPALLGTGQALQVVNGRVMTMLDRTPVIMAIMDEFSATALAPDATLLRPTPTSWRSMLEDTMIDALIVESAWDGNGGAWHHKVGYYNEEEIQPLRELVDACRSRNIPTIFYNKEDPVHFDRFAQTSALFDHVFTTDEQCTVRYETLPDTNIQSVRSIQFAAQPAVHHPYNTRLASREGIAFAGTYYAGKYPDRCETMDMLFDASSDLGLVIYDRQSDGGNPNYVFPERFSHNIRGKLAYTEMLEAHRKHKIFLNVNSVQTSKTMAARRIFEIPASGACLISGPGLAVREVFGNTVPMVYSNKQANATLAALMADEAFLRYTIQASRHIVLKRHLNNHRLQKMLNASSLTLQRPSSVADTVIVSDTSTSIRDICLWFARQELEFTHLILPSAPTTKAEELLVNLLQNRGLKVSYEQPEQSTSPTILIYNVMAFDHHGLDALFNEMRSTRHTVHLKSSTGDLLATCEQSSSEVEFSLEYHETSSTPQKLISTITDHTFTEVPSTILIAGHDLKFAMPIVEVLEEMGIRVLVDKWDNHNKFDAEKSRSLLEKADAVWCEWALGNVEWYSHAIKSGMPLFVRYHLQERNYQYLTNSNQEAISNIAFVCQHYEVNAREIGQIDDTTRTSVIPNTMNIRGKYKRKNDNYSIGFVGMVPARKRLDLALDLLEELLQHDSRYTLKVVGKNPEEYGWLMKRDDEREYYQNIRSRLESNPLLKSRVEFLGFVDDIREFYSSVGHVISTSDFESYHLTLADGPLHGAAAHSLRWDGADHIYTKSWLNETIFEIAKSIRAQNDKNTTAYEAEKQSLHLVPQMSSEIIALSILQALGGVSE